MTLTEDRVWKGQAQQVALGVTKDVVLTLPRRTAQIDLSTEVIKPLDAPLAMGDVVGRVVMTRSGEPVGEVPLEVLQAIEPVSYTHLPLPTILLV